MIAQLKPLDRQVILLYLEDIGTDAMAEITGLSPGAVTVRVHRIKRLLAAMVQTRSATCTTTTS